MGRFVAQNLHLLVVGEAFVPLANLGFLGLANIMISVVPPSSRRKAGCVCCLLSLTLSSRRNVLQVSRLVWVACSSAVCVATVRSVVASSC